MASTTAAIVLLETLLARPREGLVEVGADLPWYRVASRGRHRTGLGAVKTSLPRVAFLVGAASSH